MHRTRRLLCVVFLLSLLTLPKPATALAPHQQRAATSPFLFIENTGQFAAGARFQVRGGDHALWLAEDGLWVTFWEEPAHRLGRDRSGRLERENSCRAVHLRLSFLGANPKPHLEPFEPLGTRVSFFLGSDPERWRANVPVWGGVRYVDLYPGLDLELAGEGGRLAQRLVVREPAGATSLSQVRLQVEGADSLALDGETGRLRVRTALGEHTLPLFEVTGGHLPEGGPAIEEDTIITPFAAPGRGSSAIAQADGDGLAYSTLLGGAGGDWVYGVAVDSAGRAYVTGVTYSADFPATPGAYDSVVDAYDSFVAQVNESGTALVYATLFGGAGNDYGEAIALDGAGNAYICGDTTSGDLPVTPGAFDASLGGAWDVFVAKLGPGGTNLAYATYLGGSSTDFSGGIAVDGAGQAHVVGETSCTDFPTTPGAYDTTHNGGLDRREAFVTKLNPQGTGLVYSTYFGGSSGDWGEAIALDGNGRAYITGETSSRDLPVTAGAYDTRFGGAWDVFVATLDAQGASLGYATYIGGSGGEWGSAIAIDDAGQVYIAGDTMSADWPTTPGAYQSSRRGDSDAFVVKLNAAGSGLVYATLFGGTGDDAANGIVLDGSGQAYICGDTDSEDLPTTQGAFRRTYIGDWDAFVARLNAGGSALTYSTYLGGTATDGGEAIALDGAGRVYVAGITDSTDFPVTPDAFDTVCEDDAFIVKMDDLPAPVTPQVVVYLPLVLK